MRLKRGSEVEVMNKSGGAVLWRKAEILSVNDHSCEVRYDCYPHKATQTMVETVTRKFVRPCPPLAHGMENWTAGSIVEVFDACSWKIAMILKILIGDLCLVRLLGSSQELRIKRSNIRMRHTWRDDKWILMEKVSRGCDYGKDCELLASDYCQRMNLQAPEFNALDESQSLKYYAHIQRDNGAWESRLTSTMSRKRTALYCSSVIKANNVDVKKSRVTEKEETKNRVIPVPRLDKVDAVAYPRKILGEEYMHTSSNNRSYGHNQMERDKLNDIHGFYGSRSSEFNDSDSDACSVGSCSVTSQSPAHCYAHVIPVPRRVTDNLCSDAESCYGSGSGSEGKSDLNLPKEEVEASIHRLELNAYRSTLEALHASGPLSWDKEALLTNLRIMLHVSNDEHLMELKYLISTKNGTNVR